MPSSSVGAKRKVQKCTRAPKNGAKSQLYKPKLTETQKDVLFLLAQEKLTVPQVAFRRGVKPRSVYKVRQQLIEKGVLNVVNDVVQKDGGLSSVPSVHHIRLHNEQYHVKILWCDDKYRKRCREGTGRLVIDGQTVMLYRNVVEIYSNKSFYGSDPNEANAKSMRYWQHFFARLEQNIKVILVKRESQNIIRVRSEYAESDNELATKVLKEHEQIRVNGSDGKLWLLVDNSFNLKEMETVHPIRSSQDMQNVVQPFFNDLRENDHIPLSSISKSLAILSKEVSKLSNMVCATAETSKINAEVLGSVLTLMKTQLTSNLPKQTIEQPQQERGVPYYIQ